MRPVTTLLGKTFMARLHDSLTVIDGLIVSCTCLIWEGFVDTSRRCNLKWMLLQM